ncbi:MAG TPA: hypothetical protein VL460_02460 [Caulobacteraceae bacterium]|jgi:hypothetical protein|nr:hypothetical protein [Caulobacteraceae bacterium]
MRRTAALALSALLLSASPAAFAATVPPVTVTIGADLQSKADKSYGVRELADLSAQLRHDVERAFARASAAPVQRVDLVIESATPNRPTFKQLKRIGLSLNSIGLGGASISGTVTTADGKTTPVSYHWYETDLRNEYGLVTWSDAYRAFDRFAGHIARGDLPAQAKYTPDRDAGDFGRWLR